MAAAKTPAQQAPPTLQNNSGRIKYADPRSLPSFPSSGLAPDSAAASAAASLGWSNQKPVNLWKPDPSSSASAAAVLAKDYKMSPQWEPSVQSDGHKAALLAVGSAGAALKKSDPKKSVPVKSAPSQDSWGNSAANQAFHASRPSSSPQEPVSSRHGSSAATQAFNLNRSQSTRKAERPQTPPGNKSLMAAKGAMNRPASTIGITGLKDVQASEASAAVSALNGATLAHRQSMKAKPKLDEAGAVSVTTMTRNMFTANPPVKPEVDERTYNEKIHQSAVEMAKKMYARQQIMVEQTKSAQAKEAETTQTNPYVNLQDAAYKQAQARLAKLHDEYHQSREYQEYYGHEQNTPRNRSSMISKLRRRGSDSDTSLDDRRESEKIRDQMSMFSSKLSQVDKEKREKDREALLAAAQRNVKARLHGMDEKVYAETGRANPSLITDWEAKARKAAQARFESRTEEEGKIDVGGGMFMTQAEIDAIASKRIQPVLDDINDKAENERERQEVLKLEEQARREEAEKQKTRDREAKEIVKKTKEQDKQEEKARKLKEKQEEKAKKDEEKNAKAEQKRQAKEEKRKSKSIPAAVAVTSTSQQENHNLGDGEAANGEAAAAAAAATESNVREQRPTVETNIESTASQRRSSASSSPTSKVKGWIKNRFSRGKSFGEHDKKRRSLFGGGSAKDKHAAAPAANGSAVSLEDRTTSMHEVALAGKTRDGPASSEKGEAAVKDKTSTETGKDEADEEAVAVSPLSTPLEEERELGDGTEESRQSRKASIEPPKPIEDPVARSSSSPTRDSRFREEMDR